MKQNVEDGGLGYLKKSEIVSKGAAGILQVGLDILNEQLAFSMGPVR